jgi:hypothetical protein
MKIFINKVLQLLMKVKNQLSLAKIHKIEGVILRTHAKVRTRLAAGKVKEDSMNSLN